MVKEVWRAMRGEANEPLTLTTKAEEDHPSLHEEVLPKSTQERHHSHIPHAWPGDVHPHRQITDPEGLWKQALRRTSKERQELHLFVEGSTTEGAWIKK